MDNKTFLLNTTTNTFLQWFHQLATERGYEVRRLQLDKPDQEELVPNLGWPRDDGWSISVERIPLGWGLSTLRFGPRYTHSVQVGENTVMSIKWGIIPGLKTSIKRRGSETDGIYDDLVAAIEMEFPDGEILAEPEPLDAAPEPLSPSEQEIAFARAFETTWRRNRARLFYDVMESDGTINTQPELAAKATTAAQDEATQRVREKYPTVPDRELDLKIIGHLKRVYNDTEFSVNDVKNDTKEMRKHKLIPRWKEWVEATR